MAFSGRKRVSEPSGDRGMEIERMESFQSLNHYQRATAWDWLQHDVSTEVATSRELENGGRTIVTTLTPSALRIRGSKALRRTREHVDGLTHLSFIPVEAEYYTDEIKLFRDIVLCLVRLDLWMMGIAMDRDEFDNFDMKFIEEIGNLYFQLDSDLVAGMPNEEKKIQQYVQKLSKQQLLDRMHDLETLPYYESVLDLYVHLCQEHKARQRLAEAAPRSCIPGDSKEKYQGNVAEYLVDLVWYTRESRNYLRAVMRMASELCNHIVVAASSGKLGASTIERLKLKVEALQQHYGDACEELGEELGEERRDLIDIKTPWWAPYGEMLCTELNDNNPKHITAAFPPSSNHNATIAFAVPIITILSLIPAALAWVRSSRQIGTVEDADFWQLVSASTLQLLSISTMMISTMSSSRLIKHAWFWTWILAGVGTCCSVIAVPLYLYVPTEWSAAVSSAGSVAQTLVILQLMFAI